MKILPSLGTVLWLGTGIYASHLAQKKGYSKGQWYYFAMVLGVIAVVIILILPNKNITEELKNSDEIDYWVMSVNW